MIFLKKTKAVLAILKALDIKVKEVKNSKTPNKQTLLAMQELKNGKGVKFESVAALFNSIK